ncbi:pyridoxal phosphate-dependent aminotransferase [Portibacter lacus]|uniref:Histidinol-phosphate aminotransferase n=1 Tax=Portibacter lacus TaxID=1099794 RepID=A0AA37SPH0_9BACT|nr:histidinol-phosphate transaminase [Portibacter lacus]GLR15515.1 histidinol-phosphate aminotransferase [Portibacter lacus]
MVKILPHIQNLTPYKPGKSSDPSDFIRYKAILSSNENNYGPSPLAMEAIRKNLSSINLYPDPLGESLVTELAKMHHRNEEEIILSNGLDGLLYSMFKAFTLAGDHVVTNDNSFVAFNKFSLMNDLALEIVSNIDYAFDLEQVVASVKENTKMVYLCNPNNPTGMAIGAKELKRTISRISSNVLVIIDEAYFAYAQAIDADFPDSSLLNLPNVLTLRTFSKLYGLAGVRIGYAIGSSHVINVLKKVKLVFNPNLLAQVAATAALGDEEHVAKTLTNNTKWIHILQDQFAQKNIRTLPSYANFICAIFSDATAASKFFEFMDSKDILLRKLDGFGMPEGVRVSIGNDEEMKYFSETLQQF